MTLTRTGPYAYVRNPIYIGNTLICTGITIMSELLWLVPFTIIVCAISYHLTVLHEEKKLSRLYGEEYLRYMDEVPRWIPRLRGKKELDLIVREYFAKSLRAEAYNLLLLIPMLVKELVT
jgi:steroid 5-alpha reductase family enzyme